VRNINLSPIGDFICMTGYNVLTIWSRDSEAVQSFSNVLYYSKEEPKDVFASVIKQKELGIIVQSEISHDGRLIFYMEENSRSLNILYQDKIIKQTDSKDKKKEEEKQEFKLEGKLKNVVMDFNPYENIVPISAEEQEQSRLQDLKLKIEDLFHYKITHQRGNIEYFKLMFHDLYETEKKLLPNVIITVTSNNDIYLWQENIVCSEMKFVCLYIFRGLSRASFFDATLIEFPPVNPKLYHEIESKISKIFDTYNDPVLTNKKSENLLGIYHENYHEKTLDWLLILKESVMDVYRVEGLRNFPPRNVKVINFKQLQMNASPKDFHGVCKIYQASCRDMNDVISIYCLNSSFQLIKYRKNFNFKKAEELKVNGHPHSQLWKLDQLSIIN